MDKSLPFDVHPRCPNCGYTYCDCQMHGDHRLCSYPTPEKPTATSLSSLVARLEQDRNVLADLCGEVLATVRVNWDRGTLAALPTEAHTEKAADVRERFTELLDIWESRLKETKADIRCRTNAEIESLRAMLLTVVDHGDCGCWQDDDCPCVQAKRMLANRLEGEKP